MLHLLFLSSYPSSFFERFQPHSDVLLFLDNAVLLLLENALHFTLRQHSCFVLDTDLTLRGIKFTQIQHHVQIINAEEWVKLTVQHEKVVSWF